MNADPKPTTLYLRKDANGDLIFRWTADLGPFEAARSALRASFSCPDDLYFDGRLKAWRLAGDQAEAFQAWANAHFAPDHQRVWTPDPDEGADDPRGRSYRAYTSSDHAGGRGGRRTGAGGQRAGTGRTQPGGLSVLEQAYKTLCVTPQAPPELVEGAYRILARLNHPDRGGDTQAMVALNAAVATIRAAAASTCSGAA